ncbi:hypothetical protein [Paenibacillus terrae]|uniref:hypothetical protein n=1 Tax=Paenibacillus terrae TaxID=159743 RepID=UPI00148500EB|nr:hypothetical protein [Paenibacillus terrae]
MYRSIQTTKGRYNHEPFERKFASGIQDGLTMHACGTRWKNTVRPTRLPQPPNAMSLITMNICNR